MGFIIAVGVIVLVAIILLVFGLSRPSTGQALVEERLGSQTAAVSDALSEEQDGPGFVSTVVDRAVAGRGFAANLKWTVGEFLVLTLLASLSLGLAAFVIKRYIFIPVGVIAGFFIPRIYLGSRKTKRLKEFNDQLGDSLNLMVNSLRAGYSTMQALEVISTEMPAPISEEYGRVVLELQLGVSFDTAMANLLRRMPSPDLDLVITAMSVQREVGGNLAEVLDAISFTIRERVRIKGEIKILTSQGRATGTLITFLPVVLTGVISLINPSFTAPLFNDPCGWMMLGLSVVLIVVGYIVINKIVSIEV